MVTWLGIYAAPTPGGGVADNTTVRLDLDNEPQPDAILIVLPEHGGQSRIDEERYLTGTPALVVEVVASSASYAVHAKLDAYRRNGVREYLVWRGLEQAVDWLTLHDSAYVRQPLGTDGLLCSAVLPGLWLDPAALLRGDLATVLAVVQQGIDSPEHVGFLSP